MEHMQDDHFPGLNAVEDEIIAHGAMPNAFAVITWNQREPLRKRGEVCTRAEFLQ